MKALHLHDNTFSTPMVIDPSMKKMIDNKRLSNDISEVDYLEKLFKQKENIEERKITFGLSIIEQCPLDSFQQYQCIDFYDIEQEYIIMCNVLNLNNSKDQLNSQQIQSQSISIIEIELELNVNISFQINLMTVNFSYIQSIKIYPMKFSQWNLIVHFNFIL
jgi:hypothetical protein